jgi:hypothetical protein
LYVGTTPTNVINSLIFNHSDTNISSKWWFNGTQQNTNAEISDERIKSNIIDINKPLELLSLINPKEYYLKEGKKKIIKYGFIAQDIKNIDVLKHFVHEDTDYIGNIYCNATYNNRIITCVNNINGLINVDDEIKIIIDNNDKNNLEIIIDSTPFDNRYKYRYGLVINIINDYSFEIKNDLIDLNENESNNLFLYGKKVNDFNKLDYESLYCLNIAATKELYKIIQNQQEQINNLINLIKN